jgi:hypothetical protein
LASLAAIKIYAPDLTFISLGIKRRGISLGSATLNANLQTLIATAQVSGDVILMSMPPFQDDGRIILERVYEPDRMCATGYR